jgi:hypothetical protein
MGYDLVGDGGTFRWDRASWGTVFALARGHGWEPAGTRPPAWKNSDGTPDDELNAHYADWSGSYFWNDLQTVTREDAANLAEALEKVTLADLVRAFGETSAMHGGDFDPEDGGMSLYERLRKFVSFCWAGSFSVG